MKIFNFLDFILEKFDKVLAPFQYSDEFELVLKKIGSPISTAIENLRLQLSEISLIDIDETQSDSITFTTSTKLSQHFNTDSDTQLATFVKPLHNSSAKIYHLNRTSTKIGRVVRKLFGQRFSDSEIEKFVNEFKNIVGGQNLHLEIWEGSKILDGYDSTQYVTTSQSNNPLMNSCMNDEFHLLDFYKYIPVKLLVLLDEEGLIHGRALIWNTNSGKFMDRVYCAKDKDYYKFIDWAKDSGVIYKSKNKSSPDVPYIIGDRESWFKIEVKLPFEIEKWDIDDYTGKPRESFPYLDTFVYAQGDKLQNFEPEKGSYYLLQETDGTYCRIDPIYDIYGTRLSQSDADRYYVYSKTQNGWIYHRSAVWLDSEGDYFSTDYLLNPANGFKWDDTKKAYVKIKK